MTAPTTYKLGFPKLKNSLVPMASGAPFQRDPTSADYLDPRVGAPYAIGTIWPNEATGGVWILAQSSGGVASWLGITDAASGNVDGPASATDNALARFDGTTGKLIQNSVGLLSDVGVMTGVRPTLPAGTATAGTAPMKFTLGVNLGTPEAGAVEYDGTHLYYTNNSAARQTVGVGPSTSTDNRLARMDGTSGAYQEATGTTLSDDDVMTFPADGGVVLTTGTRKGTATLVGGTATVTTAAAVTGSVICLTIVALGTVTDPMPMLVTINNGVGFDITSEDATDTSTINWAIVG
jgi:hypothetical protein